MSDVRSDASLFLGKNLTNKHVLARIEPTNAFQSMFSIDLDENEEKAIDLLISGNNDALIDQEKLDLKKLKELTCSIKGISKVGVLLIGKQVHEARTILQKYNQSGNSFNQWLKIAFKNSRSTAYNALAYYELHEALPNEELKQSLKAIPHKAAYLLASRQGKLEQKVEVLKNHQGQSAMDLMALINSFLPLPDRRKRSIKGSFLIHAIRHRMNALVQIKQDLTEESRSSLIEIRALLEEILR
jgi:hypothetical protein